MINVKGVSRIAGASLITLPLLLYSFIASAQTPVYIDGAKCRNITVDLARVACYDTLTDNAMQKSGVRASAPEAESRTAPRGYDRQLLEKNRQMREELARLRQAEAGRAARSGTSAQRSATNKNGDKVFYDRIKALRKVPDGWIIDLESGQVWRQMVNKRYELREGQEVKLSPTIWGDDYHLSVKELGGFIQVKRVR